MGVGCLVAGLIGLQPSNLKLFLLPLLKSSIFCFESLMQQLLPQALFSVISLCTYIINYAGCWVAGSIKIATNSVQHCFILIFTFIY